uniref:Uncharacterized protein MANES_02G183700 n=1 Tax=Rhizophora mucronata TaxID=61149 RepID=A0A2P2LUB2_RHIMU
MTKPKRLNPQLVALCLCVVSVTMGIGTAPAQAVPLDVREHKRLSSQKEPQKFFASINAEEDKPFNFKASLLEVLLALLQKQLCTRLIQ